MQNKKITKKIGNLAVRNHINKLCEPTAEYIEKALLSGNFSIVSSGYLRDKFYFTVSINTYEYHLVNNTATGTKLYIDTICFTKNGGYSSELHVDWYDRPLTEEATAKLMEKVFTSLTIEVAAKKVRSTDIVDVDITLTSEDGSFVLSTVGKLVISSLQYFLYNDGFSDKLRELGSSPIELRKLLNKGERKWKVAINKLK